MAATTIALFYFAECPNNEAAREIVERVADEAGAEIDLRLVEVGSAQDAERLRFLGSPSVRVNGRDIEPSADGRRSYVFACRVYRTELGVGGLPSERWVRAALGVG